MESRAVTAEELRDRLLEHFHSIATHWADDSRVPSTRDKIEGAIFSCLSTLDGSSLDLPAFDLVARPHADDKQYHIDNGENWIEPGTTISDTLHEHWFASEPKT